MTEPRDVPARQPEVAPEVLAGGPQPRRGALPVLATGVATALVVAGATGGVLAYRALSGGGAQPDRYAPASAFAFASVDLDPSAGQKIAARRFANHFPATKGKDFPGLRDRVLSALFADAKHVDYAKDVKPWIGDRAAVTGFLDRAGKPQFEVIVASRDAAKAKRSLSRTKNAHFSVQDGFVVLANTKAALDEALEAARKRSLADDPTYRNDLARIPDGRIFTAWVDGRRANKAVRTALAKSASPLGALQSVNGSTADGRLVLSGRVAATYVELEGRSIGGDTGGLSAGSARELTQLPSGTAAAILANGMGKAVAARSKQLTALLGGGSGTGRLRQFEAQTGLRLPRDLITLLGDTTVVAVADVGRAALPNAAWVSRSARPDEAERVARILARVIRAQANVPVTTARSDDRVAFGIGAHHPDEVLRGGALGRTPAFRTAMGELGDTVYFAGYADLSRLGAFGRGQSSSTRALKAVGVSVRADGKESVLRVRVTVE